jgi:crossover junction endodeoxyribonuclease RuvC
LSLVVGIDPGSGITGYGVVEHHRSDVVYVGSGVIRLKRAESRPERLRALKEGIDGILARYRPDSVAVEEIFVARNPRSTMVLGEARGVIILAAAEAGIPVYEYSPREVKCSVVGSGAAHKSQVAFMIGKHLRLEQRPRTEDETDALAVAFCHALRMTAGRMA